MLSTNEGIGSSTLSQGYGFTTPANIYNNTIVMNSNGSGTPYPAAWIVSQTANNINFYNNVYTGAADASGYGTFVTNAGAIAIWDYNLLTTGMNWVLRQNGSLGSVQATYTSLAAWKAGVAANGGPNVDGHSVQNNSPGFTNSGTLDFAVIRAFRGSTHYATRAESFARQLNLNQKDQPRVLRNFMYLTGWSGRLGEPEPLTVDRERRLRRAERPKIV